MFKRLFLVIFILQSFASTAMAGMNMSQLNQADMTKMQMLHSTMNMGNMPTRSSSNDFSTVAETASMMNCPNCLLGDPCTDVSCNSIHTVASFYGTTDFKLPMIQTTAQHNAALFVSILHSSVKPETPPPVI